MTKTKRIKSYCVVQLHRTSKSVRGGSSSLLPMRSPACSPAEVAGSSAESAVTEAAAAPALECVCGVKTGVCDEGSPGGWGWW